MTEFTLKDWDVLVVDDEPDILLLIEYILGLYGANVTCAHSGQEALDLLEVHVFHLGLFDILMPKITGWELVKAVRESKSLIARTMPLVAVTALAMPGDASRLIEAGYDAYIAKPIDAESFAKTIRALVLNDRGDKQQARDERQAMGDDTLAMADQLRRLLHQTLELPGAESSDGEFEYDVAELFTKQRERDASQAGDGADVRFEQARTAAEASVVSPKHESAEDREVGAMSSAPRHSIRGFFRRHRHNA